MGSYLYLRVDVLDSVTHQDGDACHPLLYYSKNHRKTFPQDDLARIIQNANNSDHLYYRAALGADAAVVGRACMADWLIGSSQV